jgi:hypothetical protein
VRILSCLLISGALMTAAIAHPAPDRDFDGVVDGLEQHYGISGHRIPMMGFAGFCARLATHGGVKGLQVAEFKELGGGSVEADDISRVIGEQLGSEWRPVVKDHERHGLDQTVIFVRPAGHAMRLLIANYEQGELNVVRVELDGEELAKWMKGPGDPTRHSRRGDGDSGRGDEAESRAE